MFLISLECVVGDLVSVSSTANVIRRNWKWPFLGFLRVDVIHVNQFGLTFVVASTPSFCL